MWGGPSLLEDGEVLTPTLANTSSIDGVGTSAALKRSEVTVSAAASKPDPSAVKIGSIADAAYATSDTEI